MKLKYTLLSGLGFVAIWLLVSCQPETEPTIVTSPVGSVTGTKMSQPLVGSTMASTRSTATTTKPVKATSSPVPDPSASSPMALETATPSPTLITPAVVTTLTPLPTLEGEELESAVAELLAKTMNCNVPCWWGAIPGVTNLDEIKHDLSPYNFHISEYAEDEEVVYLLLEMEYVEDQGDFEIGIVYNFSQSILVGITAYSPSVFEVLARYGQPDEVWLETGITPLPIPFQLNLVYYQEGMAFGYVADGVVENDIFIGCFADEETGQLRLEIPSSVNSYRDFSPIFEDDRRYLPLEEATGLTMEDFMQQFSDPSQPQCVETPIKLWD